MEPMSDASTLERTLINRATAKLIPIYGILELTPLCNMNCDMCFVRLSKAEMEAKGRLRTLAEWKNLADQMQKEGTLFVLLTGGEPLLYPGFRDLYLHLRKLGMIITVNTNGTLINEEWADFFALYKPRRINITVYGKNAQTYDQLCHHADGYDRAVRAIQLLCDRGIDVKMNGSITPSNADDSADLLTLAKQLDVPCKIDTYMYPASRERHSEFNYSARMAPSYAAKIRTSIMEKQPNFEAIAKNFIYKAENASVGEKIAPPIPCRAGRSSFVINWQGMMRPCILVTFPEIAAFDQDFHSAWKSLVEATATIRLSPKCNACTLRDVCQTCAACALLETGSYDGTPEYMCQYTLETLNYLKASLKNNEEAKAYGQDL